MFHIVRHDNHEERSLHKNLQQAKAEADFRAIVSDVPHEVIDESGRVVFLALPSKARRREIPWNVILTSALAMASILWAVFAGRVML